MKTATREVRIYEPGDILEINVNKCIRLTSKKERLKYTIVRIMIIKTNDNKERISYNVVSGDGICMILHNDELTDCKFIRTIDIEELTKEVKVI